MKRLRLVFLLALVADSAASAWAWSKLPTKVPMHWDLHGEVSRSGARWEALLLGPGILVVLWVVAEALRSIDPKLAVPPREEQSQEEREGALWTVFGIAALLVALLHGLVIAQALGLLREPQRAHALLLAGFQIFFGNFVGRLRPSWFVGIRTPWTLSSDEVWRRTHRLAASLMVLSGIAALVLALTLPSHSALVASVGLLALSLLVPAALSFVFWRRTV